MVIKSEKDYASGQPRIEGHRTSVQHVVANVNCLGLEGYVKELWTDDDGQLFDEKIRDKIKEAVEYCRTEQCDVDNENGN